MQLKLSLLAAAGLLSLSACGVYQDYPNDNTAVESHNGYYHSNRASSHHPYHMRHSNYYAGTHAHGDHMHHDHSAYGHDHTEHHAEGVVVEGQDPHSYMEQNDDKWMYNSCPPGAAKRGDC